MCFKLLFQFRYFLDRRYELGCRKNMCVLKSYSKEYFYLYNYTFDLENMYKFIVPMVLKTIMYFRLGSLSLSMNCNISNNY